MFSKLVHTGVRFSYIPFAKFFGRELDDIPSSQLKVDISGLQKETGWDRVKKMYSIE